MGCHAAQALGRMGPVCAAVADGRAVERLAEALLIDGHWEVGMTFGDMLQLFGDASKATHRVIVFSSPVERSESEGEPGCPNVW